jgi:hypothetical protein
VFVTTANAKQERAGVYNLSSGQRNYNASDFSIIWDTGASQSVTFSKEDFTTGIDYFTRPQNATGIASGLEILGKGMVRWDISLNDGTVYPIAIEALYCPKANRRLLCPQQFKKTLDSQNPSLTCSINIEKGHIHFRHGQHQIFAEYDTQTNLPMSYGRTSGNLNLEMSVDEINACLTDQANQNLTKGTEGAAPVTLPVRPYWDAAHSRRHPKRANSHHTRAKSNAHRRFKVRVAQVCRM